MNEKRHSPMIPILFLFFGVLLGTILFKSKLMYCEGEECKMACCCEDKDRIRHFGCCQSSKDFDSDEEESQ